MARKPNTMIDVLAGGPEEESEPPAEEREEESGSGGADALINEIQEKLEQLRGMWTTEVH